MFGDWGKWVEGTGEFRNGRSDRDLSGLVVVTLDVRVVVRLLSQVSKTLLLSYVGLDGVGSATKERAYGQQGIDGPTARRDGPMRVARRDPFGGPPSGRRVVLPQRLELLERETVPLLDEEEYQGGSCEVAPGKDESVSVPDVAGDEGRKEGEPEMERERG